MKTFKSIKELLNYDFSLLEPQKSNWLKITPPNGIRPRLKSSSQLNKWIFISQDDSAKIPQIFFEITPKWLTITIIEPLENMGRREDFELKQKYPKSVIQELFDYGQKGQDENISLDLFFILGFLIKINSIDNNIINIMIKKSQKICKIKQNTL